MYSAMLVDDYEAYRNEIKAMDVWGDISGIIITAEASDGHEALIKLRHHPVDLLLTDIRMPLVTGIELLRKVTEEGLCACVILMSQFSDFEYARQGLSNGAFEYLLKPVDSIELLKSLIRAAAHIKEKSVQISEINYLHKILDKGTDEYFPDAELNDLMNTISEGSMDAIGIASHLVNITLQELGFDMLKASRLLSRVLKNLIESVQVEFPWLVKFINLQEYRSSDFSFFIESADLKEAFIKKIETIITIIRKYELGIDTSSLVRMSCKTILENIDSDITVNEISNKLFITRTYLSQLFKDKTGLNLVKYLTDVKIERAKFLIMSGSKNNEISEILGYKDDEYFKKLFKKATGMTINEFKNVTAT